jgi:hypothetical protein
MPQVTKRQKNITESEVLITCDLLNHSFSIVLLFIALYQNIFNETLL